MGWCTAKALTQLVRRFAQKQDGAAAIEFAIVALPFIWLLLIVFEAAAMLFTDIAIQNGVTDTARLIRTGQVQTQSMSATKFKQIMCGKIASYIDCSKIRVDISKSATLPITGVNMMTVSDTTAQSFQAGGPSEWVLVQARYDWKLFIPGISQLSNYTNGDGVKMRRLISGTMFRNEPYGG
jgi:Flp pilus assembly protein TadG